MGQPDNHIIKSFKHNGKLHRMWLENRRVPQDVLYAEHSSEDMIVTVNYRTKIVEADGGVWFSRSPGVSFFIPGQWFNVVALIEDGGVRYYCNVASPPYLHTNVLTYIDYDLDLILTPAGEKYLADEDEYERHKASYHYSRDVEDKVQSGLLRLTERMDHRAAPFRDEPVLAYYEWWKKLWGGRI